MLTKDGILASEEGIVHVPENGKIRLWVINHPIAGVVPIHATEQANLPIDEEATNKDNHAKSCLMELVNLSETLANEIWKFFQILSVKVQLSLINRER